MSESCDDILVIVCRIDYTREERTVECVLRSEQNTIKIDIPDIFIAFYQLQMQEIPLDIKCEVDKYICMSDM